MRRRLKMPKVSIIVPVYNTERYLDKCLTSLVRQTLDDIEIIVVNDGSPDNSQKIIDIYVNKYPERIKAYIKPNGGLSDARNFGILKARGEYIGFVDSDDYVSKSMYEKLYNKAKEANYEMVECLVSLVYEDKPKGEKIERLNNIKLIDSNDRKEIKQNLVTMYPTVWNKIYKKNIILQEDNKMLFKEGIWFEDTEWMLRLYPSIESIGSIQESLYFYLQRSTSITFTYNEKLYDFINNMKGIVEHYKEKGLYEEYKNELEYLFARYAYITFPKRLSKTKNKKMYNKGIDYGIMSVKDFFPDYKKNIYLKQKGLKNWYIKNFNKTLSHINYYINKDKKYN